ncbi:hypothetical protein ACCD04_05410 [Telluria sp. Tellsp131]
MRMVPMAEPDLDAVLAVQAACYPQAMREAADVVRARLRAAGQGVARRLVDAMLARAGGLGHSALVSVQDSRRFWENLGYAAAAGDGAALATYPADALYMVRRLSA